MNADAKHHMEFERIANAIQDWRRCDLRDLSDAASKHSGAALLYVLRLGMEQERAGSSVNKRAEESNS